jgi:hypothetical protein
MWRHYDLDVLALGRRKGFKASRHDVVKGNLRRPQPERLAFRTSVLLSCRHASTLATTGIERK